LSRSTAWPPGDKAGLARDAAIPDDDQGRLIRLGRDLVADTKRLLPDKVGAALNCTNCHLGASKVPLAAPFVGVAVNYPRNNPRAGRVVILEHRRPVI
jgi:thiosulfate dehydrogenase